MNLMNPSRALRWVLLVMFLVGAVLFGALWERSPLSDSEPARLEASAGGDELDGSRLGEYVSIRSHSTPIANSEGSPTTQSLSGWVVDAVTQAPVRALISLRHSSVWTSLELGLFSLPLQESDLEITISARGYETAHIPVVRAPGSLQLGKIPLTARDMLTFRVTDETGAPLLGAAVWGTALTAGRGDVASAVVLLGNADVDGVLEVRCPSPLSVFASWQGAVSEPQVIDLELELTLRVGSVPTQAPHLVWEKDMAPASGLEVELDSVGGAASFRIDMITGPDGLLQGSVVPPGEYVLRLRGCGSDLTWLQIRPAGLAKFRREVLVRVDQEHSAEVVLRDRDCYLVRALDRAAGKPVGDFLVGITGQNVKTLEWYTEFPDWAACEPRDGVMRVTASLPTAFPTRLLVSAPGYMTAEVVIPVGFDSLLEVQTVFLEPVVSRRIQLLVAPDLHAFSGPIYLRDSRSKAPLFAGDTRTGLIELNGGDGGAGVDVASDRRLWPFDHIPQAELVGSEDIPIHILELGSIEVHGAPKEHLSIECEAATGRQRWSGVRTGDRIVFEDLPPGVGYEVGTPEELSSAKTRLRSVGETEYPVKVIAGEVTRIAWNASWTAVPPIEGTLEIAGIDPAELWVSPRYFKSERRPSRFRSPVSVEGRYSIVGLSKQPSEIVVWTRDSSRKPVALASVVPGQAGLVECGTLVVSFPERFIGSPVSLTWNSPELGRSVGSSSTSFLYAAGGVRVGPMPSAVTFLEWAAGGRSESVGIVVMPEQVTEVFIDPPQ